MHTGVVEVVGVDLVEMYRERWTLLYLISSSPCGNLLKLAL